MSGIKEVITMICLILITTGVFSILVPKSSMEKVMKFAISLFFLAGIVIPIVQGKFDFSFEIDEIQGAEYQAQIEENTKNTITILSEKKIESEVKKILKENDINCTKVDISIHIDKDDSIDISKFIVTLSKEEVLDLTTVEQLIVKEVGVKPNVVLEE